MKTELNEQGEVINDKYGRLYVYGKNCECSEPLCTFCPKNDTTGKICRDRRRYYPHQLDMDYIYSFKSGVYDGKGSDRIDRLNDAEKNAGKIQEMLKKEREEMNR